MLPSLDVNTVAGCLYAYGRRHARPHSEITGTYAGVRSSGACALERTRWKVVSDVMSRSPCRLLFTSNCPSLCRSPGPDERLIPRFSLAISSRPSPLSFRPAAPCLEPHTKYDRSPGRVSNVQLPGPRVVSPPAEHRTVSNLSPQLVDEYSDAR